MSSDDSIEIEFPSLKPTAPAPAERVAVSRAPGPIEAQLSRTSESDDLSWLTAIFAEDEPAEDLSVDGVDDTGSIEDRDEVIATVESAAPDLDEPTSQVRSELLELQPPLEQPEAEPPDDMEGSVRWEEGATGIEPPDPDPDGAADESPSRDPARKASGFREEIMSTFSQMYQ